jgi:hypothetical protein
MCLGSETTATWLPFHRWFTRQQLARHLHVTVSQGFGGPRSSSSFSCACICITNYFCSLTDKGSFSLCDLTVMLTMVQIRFSGVRREPVRREPQLKYRDDRVDSTLKDG